MALYPPNSVYINRKNDVPTPLDPTGYAKSFEKGHASGRKIKLDTPESEFNEELDAYANLLEDEAVGSSPAAPVRPIPLGIEAKNDGEIPSEVWPEDDPYEQVIRQSVAAMCSSVGFDAIDANILETLAQRLKNYVCSISLGAKLHCEVAGRTVPIATDVWLALADIGHKVDQLPGYLRHLRVTGTIAIAPPRERQEPPLLPPMLVGQSRPHPPYVHEFFPPFPEPHTYIHTEISGEPDLTYEAVRKTAAQRRREMERSLINYMMCMHPHTTLFPQFESKIRNEAKQYLREVERDKEFRKQRKEAVKAGVIEDRYRIGDNESDDSGSDELVSDEDLEEVAETEMNLVLQRIPPSCTVINPMPELRPYMSCMRSDEMKEKGDDDDEEELKESDKKENGDGATMGRTRSSGGGGDEGENQGQMYDNPYVRIAQIQRKELKFLRESLESVP
ncbi:Bromodomain associated [Trichostrongylus colubriformis]|uniref:Transcription initiation factor TFIID subunit 8 n=1 Tax=Trichostrongylus colubriformis TaxID=6319 RepID=A0AAN8IP86_TRICO